MNWKLFESFYTGNIECIARAICDRDSDFVYSANPHGVYEEYLNQIALFRRLLKLKIKSDDNPVDNKSNLLDGHKVAACITCAITKVRLITYSKTEDIDDPDDPYKKYRLDTSKRMNEQIAVLSGLSCLFEYMADDDDHLKPKSSTSEKFNLLLPETFYEKDEKGEKPSYLDSLVRALYYSNTFSNINPLLLAHIFFLIESYHRQRVKSLDLESDLINCKR